MNKDVWDFKAIYNFFWNTDENTATIDLYKNRVYTAISTIATDIASSDFALFNKNGEKVYNKKLDLINYNLLEAITTHLLLLWTCVLWKAQTVWISQLIVLRPDKIYLENKNGEKVFIYHLGNGKVMKFKKDELIIIKNFNPKKPTDELNGVSPVEAGLYSVLLDEYSTKRNSEFFKQGTKLGLVLETEDNLPANVMDRLKLQFADAIEGLKNAHKPIILEWWLKIKSISTTQKDMDFVELKKQVKDEILSYFKIPKAIIGLGEWVNLNVRYFEKIYEKRTLLPITLKIAQGLNDGLFQWQFRFINIVRTDIDNIRTDFNNWVLTINEYRQAIGRNAIKDGDKIKFTSEMVKIEIEEEKIKTKKIEILEKTFKNFKANINWTEEREEKARFNFTKRADDFEIIFWKWLKRIFEKQKNWILEELKNWKSGKYTKKRQKDLLVFFEDKLKSWLLWLGILSKPVKEFAKQEFIKNIELVWKKPDEFFTPEVNEVLNNQIKKELLKLADGVNNTTIKEIEKIVTEGTNAGLWVDEISNQVADKFEEYKDKRISNIIRTETTRYSNQQAQNARVSVWIKKKKRFTSIDERTCPYCNSLHEKTISIEKNFVENWNTLKNPKNGKEIVIDYGDVPHPPLHTRCRCIIVPVFEEN